MTDRWRFVLRGGAYDGWTGRCVDPPLVLVVWECRDCDCDGHATRDPHDPGIVLRTAESYRRIELHEEERLAVYDIGESDPERQVDAAELVGAYTRWADLGDGWPVAP